MTPSILSGIATGQEAVFPNATYLRKRYKKLQRCKVSRGCNAQPAVSDLTDQYFDPSFEAIRALNGQAGSTREPVVVHAFIKDARPRYPGTTKPLPATPPDETNTTQLERNSQSFSERVERLGQAIDKGREIIFRSSDEPGAIEVFARVPATSNTIFMHADTDRNPRQRAYTPIISPDQQQDLKNRIRAQIAASANANQIESTAAVIHHERPKKIDPRKIHIQGRDGVQCQIISPIPLDYHRSRNIATPIVSDDDSTSDVSSPTRQAVARPLVVAKHPVFSTQRDRSANAVDGATQWYRDVWPSQIPPPESTMESQQVVTNRPKREENQAGIVSWVRSVKAAFTPKKKSPTKKARKANGVFRDDTSSAIKKRIGAPKSCPDNVLRDTTNIRQPGYLLGNSFAQERGVQERKRAEVRDQPRGRPNPNPLVVPSCALAGPHHQGRLPQAELNSRPARRDVLNGDQKRLLGQLDAHSLPAHKTISRASSEVSALQHPRKVESLHPDVEFALARLEGQVSPPPASPIQRIADDASLYGSEVELELGPLRLDCPQASRRPLNDFWTHRS